MKRSESPVPVGEPAAEIQVDESQVRRLLESQFEELAGRPLQLIANGWDNSTFRLGSDLAVRLPRREVADRLIRAEQHHLARIAARVSVAVPKPVFVGVPGDGYPWAWSVVPWFDGVNAAERSLDRSAAPVFGEFLAELHEPVRAEAPDNPYRGVPLVERMETFETRFSSVRALVDDLDHERIGHLFGRALEAPVATESVWLHGDLHPKNVVVGQAGELVAVIDWGDLTSGDAATDLAALWMHFPCSEHSALLEAYNDVDASLYERARGWAIVFGAILLDTGLAGDEGFARTGRTILERVCQSDDWN